MATAILLFFWLLPVGCGVAVAALVYSRMRSQPRQRHRTAIVAATFIASVGVAAGLEAIAIIVLGNALLGAMVGMNR